MNIHMLKESELLPALHLVWDTFERTMIRSLKEADINRFREYITYKNIENRFRQNRIVLFGDYDATGVLDGVIALEIYPDSAEISLLFVRQDMQNKGIGRNLYQTVYNFVALNLNSKKLYVNALPMVVRIFVKFGMQPVGNAQNDDFSPDFVKLETYVIPGLVRPVGKKNNKKTIIIASVIIVLVLILSIVGVCKLGISMGNSIGTTIRDAIEDEFDSDDDSDLFNEDGSYSFGDGLDEGTGDGYNNKSGADSNNDASSDTGSGVDAIPEYISEDNSYTLDEDTYSFTDTEKTSTYISFEVHYPKIDGLSDSSLENNINESLKKVAMDSVDKLYDNPTDEVKEAVLNADTPVLASMVAYKVTYASENLLSVVYEDYSYRGSSDQYHYNLRTCNISLKDGTIYEVKDIIDLSDEFVKEWLSVMREEANSDNFLSELSKDELKKALEGDSKDGTYVVNFFVDKDGVEIGFDLNYEADDSNDSGYLWVTAPFSFDEIEKYQNDSDFWSL